VRFDYFYTPLFCMKWFDLMSMALVLCIHSFAWSRNLSLMKVFSGFNVGLENYSIYYLEEQSNSTVKKSI